MQTFPAIHAGTVSSCFMLMQVLPLAAFAGHDMVIWGHREDVEAGDITGRERRAT